MSEEIFLSRDFVYKLSFKSGKSASRKSEYRPNERLDPEQMKRSGSGANGFPGLNTLLLGLV